MKKKHIAWKWNYGNCHTLYEATQWSAINATLNILCSSNYSGDFHDSRFGYFYCILLTLCGWLHLSASSSNLFRPSNLSLTWTFFASYWNYIHPVNSINFSHVVSSSSSDSSSSLATQMERKQNVMKYWKSCRSTRYLRRKKLSLILTFRFVLLKVSSCCEYHTVCCGLCAKKNDLLFCLPPPLLLSLACEKRWKWGCARLWINIEHMDTSIDLGSHVVIWACLLQIRR